MADGDNLPLVWRRRWQWVVGDWSDLICWTRRCPSGRCPTYAAHQSTSIPVERLLHDIEFLHIRQWKHYGRRRSVVQTLQPIVSIVQSINPLYHRRHSARNRAVQPNRNPDI